MVSAVLRRSILASFCLAIFAPHPAFADDLTQAKKSIQSMYALKNTSAERKDVAGMMSVYTPDFTITYPNGRVINKTQLQQETEKILPSVKAVVAHDVIKTISLKGDSAFVESSRNSTSVAENPDTHKPDRIVLNATLKDVWVKSGAKWLLKQSRVAASSFIVNGKPMAAK